MRALWAGAGLAGLIVAGCAQGGASGDGRVETAVVGDQSGSAADAAPEAAGSSPSAAGYYLAAHQAEEQGDRAAAANFMAEALKQDPGNLELLNETFQLMLSEGRMDVAESLARRLVAALPQSPMPNLLLAVEDAHGGDWPAAEARMAKLPKAGLATVAAPLVRGWVLAGEGKTDDAIKALDQLASVRGFAVLRDFHAAFIEDLAGRDAAAEADYQKALGGETAPSFRVVEALANFYARHGRSADALALFEKYKASNPDTVRLEVTLKALKSGAVPAPHLKDAKSGLAEAMFDLGSALRQDTGGGVALEFMRLSYYLEPSLDITRVTLADMLDGERRDAEALALYRGVAEGSPLYFSARLRATEVLRDMGKLDEAVGELERLAAAWPDRTEPYATEGDLLRSADRFAEAAKAYDKAIARLGEPQHADWSLYYARGVALERSGEWARAEKDFLEALKLSPEQPSVLNYLGYSWVDRGEHLNKAREMIERAVKLRPNDGYIVDSLGWVLYREGHYHSAVSHLERAVELKPDDPVINDHLGDAYWRVGRVSEARFQWRRALTLKPEPDLTNQLGVKLEHGLKSSKTGEHDS
jgi:tetratricopeptide (TPR) repeat protein